MSQQSTLSSQETPTRKAAPRFTEDEKTVLIALVGEFKHIIECKKTDVARSVARCQPCRAVTDADEDSRCTSIAQPDAEANISVEGCANSHPATGAAGSSTPAATVAAETYRTPRGRMAVLEKTLAAENAIRAELQKEEHAMRIQLMQEDHDYKMREREDRRKFENQVRDLELSKLKNELEKQKLEIDILEIEKELKKEQLRRLQCNVPHL
ncbi:hypothetical protein MRX96_045597 [Rhipicephalus microplus]